LLFAAKPEQKGKSDMAKPSAPKPTLTPKKPTSNYPKGGKIDGVAKKGKTKGKMVKMAMGGLAGRNAMGAMARPQNYGGPARVTFKRGGSCGMKKGK
jgi:hypothetical protein